MMVVIAQLFEALNSDTKWQAILQQKSKGMCESISNNSNKGLAQSMRQSSTRADSMGRSARRMGWEVGEAWVLRLASYSGEMRFDVWGAPIESEALVQYRNSKQY